MVSEPMVSIIVPSWNYAQFLPDALNSVLQQSYDNWECIVVDDGSTDNTAGIAKQFCEQDSRFRYVYQNNSGVSTARNTGISKASGKLVQFLDADDLIEKDKLRLQTKFLDANKHVDIVYGEGFYFCGDQGGVTHRFPSLALEGSGGSVITNLLNANNFVMSSPLIRFSVIETIGGFDPSMQHLEDWEFWLRCAIGGVTFSYLPSAGTATLIRKHENSLSTESAKMIEANIALRKRLMASLSSKAQKSSNERELATTLIILGYEKINSGQVFAGLKDVLAVGLRNQRIKSCLYGVYLCWKKLKDQL